MILVKKTMGPNMETLRKVKMNSMILKVIILLLAPEEVGQAGCKALWV